MELIKDALLSKFGNATSTTTYEVYDAETDTLIASGTVNSEGEFIIEESDVPAAYKGNALDVKVLAAGFVWWLRGSRSAMIKNVTLTGLLRLPRYTATERDALGLDAGDAGVQIYNTTDSQPETWTGTAWEAAGGGGATLSDADPEDVGTTAPGTGTEASRDDHVHGGGGGGGLATVSTDATLGGDGSASDPLTVANPFTDADETKLDGIEAGAEVNVGSEYTAAEKSKLAAVEANATADQTDAEIVAAVNTNLGNEDWQTQGSGGGGTATASRDRIYADTADKAQATIHSGSFTEAVVDGYDMEFVLSNGGASGNRRGYGRLTSNEFLLLPVQATAPTTTAEAQGLLVRQTDVSGGVSTNVLDQLFVWRGATDSDLYYATRQGGSFRLQVYKWIAGGPTGPAGADGAAGADGMDGGAYTLPQATEAALGGVQGATSAQATATSGTTILGWTMNRLRQLLAVQLPTMVQTDIDNSTTARKAVTGALIASNAGSGDGTVTTVLSGVWRRVSGRPRSRLRTRPSVTP